MDYVKRNAPRYLGLGSEVSDEYLRLIVQDIKPFIDSNYRVLSDAEHTAMMGSSMGGLISLYALTEYPQVFGKVACLSTHWPILGEYFMRYQRETLPEAGGRISSILTMGGAQVWTSNTRLIRPRQTR